MINLLSSNKRPAWLTNLIALALVLASSSMLIYFCRDGAPTRSAFGFIVAILLLTPILITWSRGWMILFVFFPFGNLLRRVYLLFQPAAEGNDLLILLPDAVMALTALSYVMSVRWRKQSKPVPGEKELRVPIAMFLGLCFIEVFNPVTGSVQVGLNGVRQFAMWIMLYWITQTLVTRREQVYTWMSTTMVIGAITGIYGAYQYIFDFPIYDRMWAEANATTNQTIGDQMRAFSTFTFTSTFSHYMVISASIAAVALRIKGMGFFTRMLTPFYLACMLMGLAVTFVRSSYLGLLVALVIGVIMAGRTQGRWKRMLATAVISVTVLMSLPKSAGDTQFNPEAVGTGTLVADRLLTMAEPTQVGSMGHRYSAWSRVIAYSVFYPAGVGLGAGSAARINGNFVVGAMAYTESQFFSMLAELGYPGMVLFLWIVLYGLLYSLRIHDQLLDEDARRMIRMCMMVQVGISVTGITGGTVLYTLPGSAFYWTVLGLVTAIARMEGLVLVKKTPYGPSEVRVIEPTPAGAAH